MELTAAAIREWVLQNLELSSYPEYWAVLTAVLALFVGYRFWNKTDQIFLFIGMIGLIWAQEPIQILLALGVSSLAFVYDPIQSRSAFYMNLLATVALGFFHFSNEFGAQAPVVAGIYFAAVSVGLFHRVDQKSVLGLGVLLLSLLLSLKFPLLFFERIEIPAVANFSILGVLFIQLLFRAHVSKLLLTFIPLAFGMLSLELTFVLIALCFLIPEREEIPHYLRCAFFLYITTASMALVPEDAWVLILGMSFVWTRVWIELTPGLKGIQWRAPGLESLTLLVTAAVWGYYVFDPKAHFGIMAAVGPSAVLLGYLFRRFELQVKGPKASSVELILKPFKKARHKLENAIRVIAAQRSVVSVFTRDEIESASGSLSALSQLVFAFSPVALIWLSALIIFFFALKGALNT